MILNNKPFGYKNVEEVLRLYVTPRFNKLEKSLDIGDYYDYINSVGLLFNWEKEINNQRIEDTSDTLCLFKTLYNNIKHHDLKDVYANVRIYVYDDYQYVLKCKNGITTFNENGAWNDKGYWYDDCSYLGDSGELGYILEIKTNDDAKYNGCNQIFLYELCKRTYKELMESYNKKEICNEKTNPKDNNKN